MNQYPYVFLSVKSDNGTVAQIKRHSQNLYSLTVTSREIGRNKWGTFNEIMEDATIFKSLNTLPMPLAKPW